MTADDAADRQDRREREADRLLLARPGAGERRGRRRLLRCARPEHHLVRGRGVREASRVLVVVQHRHAQAPVRATGASAPIGRNLYTWTNFKGWDPDVGAGGGNTNSAALFSAQSSSYPARPATSRSRCRQQVLTSAVAGGAMRRRHLQTTPRRHDEVDSRRLHRRRCWSSRRLPASRTLQSKISATQISRACSRRRRRSKRRSAAAIRRSTTPIDESGAVARSRRCSALETFSSAQQLQHGRPRRAFRARRSRTRTARRAIFTRVLDRCRSSRACGRTRSTRMQRSSRPGRSLGTAAQDKRARAFGFFGAGASLGWLAMIYDSAGVVGTGHAERFDSAAQRRADVMKAALVMLDSAYAYATDPVANGAGGFPLPATWVGRQRADAGSVQAPHSLVPRAFPRRCGAHSGAARGRRLGQGHRRHRERHSPPISWSSVGGTTGWNIGDITPDLRGSRLGTDVDDVHGHGGRVRRLRALSSRTPIAISATATSSSSRRTSAGRQGATRAAQHAASVQPMSTRVEAVHLEPLGRRRPGRRLGRVVLRLLSLQVHAQLEQPGTLS